MTARAATLQPLLISGARTPEDVRLSGIDVSTLDITARFTGRAVYTLDVKLPGIVRP